MIFKNSEIGTCQDTVASRIFFEDECTFGTKLKFPDGGRKKNMSNWSKFGGDPVSSDLQLTRCGCSIQRGRRNWKRTKGTPRFRETPTNWTWHIASPTVRPLIAKFHFSFSGLQRLCAVLILLKLFGNIFYATFSLKFRCWGTLPPRSLSRIISTHKSIWALTIKKLITKLYQHNNDSRISLVLLKF